MNKNMKIATGLWLALFLVLATFSLGQADDYLTTLPVREQEHHNWCWDASSQAILYYYDSTPTQCAIANWTWSRTDCCSAPNDFEWWSSTNRHPCNDGNWLFYTDHGIDDILFNYRHIQSIGREYALSESTVLSESNARRPFVIRYDWYPYTINSGAHALVGHGYIKSGTTGYVYIMDPWPNEGKSWSTYALAVHTYQDHKWTKSLQITTPGEARLYNPWGDINNSTPTYQWHQLSGATWYQLRVRNSSGSIIYDEWLGSGDYSCSGGYCSYRPSMTLSSGKYTWQIKTFSGYGYGPWSELMTFTNGSAAQAQILQLWPPYGDLKPGGNANLWAEVRNTGSVTLPSTARAWYWVNGPSSWSAQYVGSALVGAMAPGATKWVQLNWNIPSTVEGGRYYYYSRVYNGSYTAQALSAWKGPEPFDIAPDEAKAQILQLYPPYGDLKAGGYAYLWAEVKNIGGSTLPSTARVWNYVNGPGWSGSNYVGSASVGGLAPGATTWVRFTWTIPSTATSGQYYYYSRVFNGSYTDAALSDWKGPQYFDVAAGVCGFDEQFNSGNASSWYRDYGSWNVVSSAYYYTPGVIGKFATSTYNATYSNMYYRARFWRSATNTLTNRLLVRASGAIGSDGSPANAYLFQYNTAGNYDVGKYVGGVWTTLIGWTDSSYINKGADWNELGAYVSGSRLYFYINDHLVWSGTDTSLTSGRVGVGFYKSTSSDGALWVDYAKLDCLSSASENTGAVDFGEISDEQQELNAAGVADQTLDAETGVQ